jgi:hypothetical protein
MGIETILFLFALIIVGAVWGLTRKSRRGGDPEQPSTPTSRPRR